MPQDRVFLSAEEADKMAALEAIKRARVMALQEDRGAEVKRSGELYKTTGVASFLQGAVQGASHGFSDDIERAMADKERGSVRGDPDSTLADKYLAKTGERRAVNHVLAKASNPMVYNAGQLAGAGAAGLATRGLFKAAGGAMKGKAAIEKAAELERAAMRVAQADRAREAAAATAKFEKRAETAARVGNAGLPSNRTQAKVFDTAHGAALGYGGLDVEKDEDAAGLDRVMRAAAGGGIGYAFAPTMAAGANYGGQATKYAQQEMGLMPKTPLRETSLVPGLAPEEALIRMLGMDEFAARGARSDGAGMMQGSQPNPLLFAEGRNTKGLIDRAITSPGGRDMVEGSIPTMPTQGQTRRIRRLADAPGGAAPAMSIARDLQAHAGDGIESELTRLAAMPERPVRGVDNEWVPALMKAFDSGDAPVAGDFGTHARILQPNARDNLRLQMYGRMKDTFDNGGFDEVLKLVQDPNKRPFFGEAGMGRVPGWVEKAQTRNGKYQAVERAMPDLQRAVERDARGPVPFAPNPADQKAMRYAMAPDDASAITGAAMPGSDFNIPRYVEPQNPAQATPMFQVSKAPIGDYMREAGRTTREKFSGAGDFSPTDVTLGGAAATATAALAEDKVIGPIVREMLQAGIPPEVIMQMMQPAGGVPGGMAPGMQPQP